MTRKRAREIDAFGDTASEIRISDFSDDADDISLTLIGKKRKLSEQTVVDDDPEDLSRFIQESIAKRDVKGGTHMVKSTKGKQKVAKGEVGGGSFQSMGTAKWILLTRLN